MPLRRPLILAALLAGLLALLVAALFTSRSEPGPRLAAIGEAREELKELTAPTDAMLARQLFGSDPGADPSRIFADARRQAAELGTATASSAPAVAEAQWELTGPTNIGGRILDIALDPDDVDVAYVAAASGGVWRTRNANDVENPIRFEPAWPADAPQPVGALAITSDGTLFAGTGETGPGGGSLTYGGDGVYRSTDGGDTWKNVGLEGSSRISRIAIDPKDERRIFVAASGPLFRAGGERGIYLSENGGNTWTRVLEGDNATTGGTDIAIDPNNPDTVYAAMWDHIREPDKRRYNGTGSGLYRSRDGGGTWQRIGGPQLGPHPAVGRIGVAVAPSNPNVLYVNASTESGVYGGAWKSTDGGQTFTPITHPLVVASHVVYGWWFARVWVDPKDPDHVFFAGLSMVESKNGGQTWANVPGLHADQHALAFDTRLPGRVYVGNDGGFYRSDQNGSRGFEFAGYQPFSQLYGLDVSEQDPSRQVAGLQDNGVNRSWSGDTAGPDRWNSYGGGDGERTLIKPNDQDFLYGCSQYGACFTKRGNAANQSFDHKVVSTRKNWFTPIEFDPENPSVVYTGGEIMSKSRDDAQTWRPISGELSKGPGRELNPLFRNFGTLTTIAPAAERTGTIYAGTDDGNLWFTHDGGGTWTKATDPDLPQAWITRVEVDRRNPQVAYVTYSGLRSGDDEPYLLRTTDGGRSWTDITGDLPPAPLNDVNVVGDDLVVASDVGVFLSRDLGATWLRLGANLPLVPVHELRYHRPTNQLFVATFGRSMWKVAYPAAAE